MVHREQAKLAKRLRRQVGQAIADFGMIEAGDKVVVAANFLIDAESNLKAALQGMAPPKDNRQAADAGATP